MLGADKHARALGEQVRSPTAALCEGGGGGGGGGRGLGVYSAPSIFQQQKDSIGVTGSERECVCECV
jgi:hypothetical protein